jgi:hypothetical protein
MPEQQVRVHFHIPVPEGEEVLPHHMSGPPKQTVAGNVGSGVPHRMACDPHLQRGDRDLATDQPWAVSGCGKCVQTPEWIKAATEMQNPRAPAKPGEWVDVSARIKECCG